MKRIILIILLVFAAIPCSAQWKNAYMRGQIFTFGVHDTSFFISTPSPAHLVWRLDALAPNVVWTGADNGIDPTQGNVTSFASLGLYLFAGMTSSNGTSSGCFRSGNNGGSWQVNGGSPLVSNGRYLLSSGVSTVYRSTDSGGSWQPVNCPVAYSFAALGSCFVASTSAGVYRSLDGGVIWNKISNPVIGLMTPMDSLLFIVSNGKLAESTDSGTDWSMVAVDSFGTPQYVNCLATDGKNLFAGTTTGFLVSTDIGKHWSPKNDSITYHDVNPPDTHTSTEDVTQIGVFDSLVFAEVHYNPFALTDYYYLFDRSIRDLTDTTQSAVRSVARSTNDTLEIYPNPAIGFVSVLAGGTSILGVQLLNVLGEDVLNAPSSYASDITLDISKLPSGTYFIRIQTSTGNTLRKIVKE